MIRFQFPTFYMQRLNFSIDSFSSTQWIYAMWTRFSVYANKNYECSLSHCLLSTSFWMHLASKSNANESNKKKRERYEGQREKQQEMEHNVLWQLKYAAVSVFLSVFARLNMDFQKRKWANISYIFPWYFVVEQIRTEIWTDWYTTSKKIHLKNIHIGIEREREMGARRMRVNV